jgi:DNA repair protein RecN (Recombination protein N)
VLRELHISGLGVIDDLDLELHPGLNVLTGETGTGKTMVTVGLMLALGARAAASLVRQGARGARSQARFDAPAGTEEWAEDGELVLARSVGADGRGSARIGGQIATASSLARLGESLVEIHGQHRTQRLLGASAQTAFLDRFAGDPHLASVAAYRGVFDQLRRVSAELDALREDVRERERELDLLRYQVDEIRATAPAADETPHLSAEETRLSHVERLLELASSAETALSDEGGVADAVGTVAASLDTGAGLDPGLAELSGRGSALAAEAAELAHDLRAYRESLSVDPERLQEVRERIAALRGLQRKYGATDREVLAFFERASERLDTLTGADDRLSGLEAEASALRGQALELARTITTGRQQAAPHLAAALREELEELGMPGARIQVHLEPQDEPGPLAAETVELRLAGGPGQPLEPLARSASGGELSRTMLACRSVLADLDQIPTLVFDEVDAGIGGEAGLAVGRRLARLAGGRQVMVVTHLPQIACFADRHVRVRKVDGRASVEVLEDGERVAELSRMLAGLSDSRGAVSHAAELLNEAARVRAGA